MAPFPSFYVLCLMILHVPSHSAISGLDSQSDYPTLYCDSELTYQGFVFCTPEHSAHLKLKWHYVLAVLQQHEYTVH